LAKIINSVVDGRSGRITGNTEHSRLGLPAPDGQAANKEGRQILAAF
jgi:hypothetical protein